MKKRLVKSVYLKFFCDSANGEYGVTHADTIDDDNGFNAVWTAQMLFHDVFEHSHEFSKYFRGDYALNIGGEMAAMGFLTYYYSNIGINGRFNNFSMVRPDESILVTTFSDVEDCIVSGNYRFGYVLESNVPYQKPIDDYTMEWIIEEYWKRVKALTPGISKYPTEIESLQSCKDYKNSVTFRKIADLHRWGYRQAAKLIPSNYHNRFVLNNFIEKMEEFVKRTKPEDLANICKGITVKIYKLKDNISWTFKLEPAPGISEQDFENYCECQSFIKNDELE